MAQALVKGPFVAPFAGGLHVETDFFKPESVVYYPYDVATSKALLKKLGLEDTDGDGYRELGRPVRSRARTSRSPSPTARTRPTRCSPTR